MPVKSQTTQRACRANFRVQRFDFEHTSCPDKSPMFAVYFCNTYICDSDNERVANGRRDTLNKILARVRGNSK